MAKDTMQHDSGTNYQRWEPAALDEVDVEVQRVKLPTAEALEDIHRQAHQEGYDLGYSEGQEAGYKQGVAKAEEEFLQMKELLASVEDAIKQFGKSTSEELLNLSLEISKQILRQSLKVRPELLLPIVRNVMESIPQHSQHPHLHLHPEDAALVKTYMQNEIALGGWKVVEDQRIARGGCRIETTATEIDATLANRWERLAAALGKDMSWLDEDGPR
ncbi:MAG: flagellar assembly protein FliH [Methylophilaceae bacterium]|uniref:flagellar assembly protein FliH n=1 Tax=Methylobacillus sp. MM3 TaxID=1848039 RepID=UPI0010425F91|nr:flagellar assembly protein FliH [Methylobacillus sp. MM3]